MCTPIVPGMEPPLITSETGQSIFAYEPDVVNGMPWWAFKTTLLCVIPTVLLLVAIMSAPNEFPATEEEQIVASGDDNADVDDEDAADDDKIKHIVHFGNHHHLDASIVEMTKDEMGRRTSYDETNEWIQRRRSSISSDFTYNSDADWESSCCDQQEQHHVKENDHPRQKR